MNRRLYVVPVAALSLALLALPSAKAQDNSVAANQEIRIQQLEGQVRDLNGQLEQMNFRVQQMTDRLDKLVADVDFRLRQVEGGASATAGEQGAAETQNRTAAAPPEQPPATAGNSAAVTRNQSSTGAAPSSGTGQPRTLGTLSQGQYNAQSEQLNQNADAAAAAAAAGKAGASTENGDQSNEQAAAAPYALQGTTPDEQYQFAFDLMRQTKYADAERALSTFVDEYPDHPLAGNASYWLGETYYVRKDYNNAAQTFAETFKKFPQSGKAPDSLLKLGMSLAALGQTADACTAFHELTARYPKASDAVKQRAAKERSKNGCK